ncbi:MAG TPA: hypothetical protein VHB21_10205 [Minicystis sp.]|nr:hypothetical protein [Minicystis sp.]
MPQTLDRIDDPLHPGHPATGYKRNERPALKPGEAWFEYEGTAGTLYYKGSAAAKAAADAAYDAQQAADEAEGRRETQETRQRQLDEAAQRKAEACKPFDAGNEKGSEYMNRKLACEYKPASDLVAAKGEFTAKVGPDGHELYKYKAEGQIGGADLEGKGHKIGPVEITDKGTVRKGVSISTPEKYAPLGKVELKVQVGTNVPDDIVQGAQRATSAVNDGPGQLAARLTDSTDEAISAADH